MQIKELMDLLVGTPVIADIRPVSLCYLPDQVQVEEDCWELTAEIDSPSPTLPTLRLVLAATAEQADRLPHVTCEHDPFTTELNTILYDRYDCVASGMLCQSQVATQIVTNARDHVRTDVILLYLVDGLSYRDVVELGLSDLAIHEIGRAHV